MQGDREYHLRVISGERAWEIPLRRGIRFISWYISVVRTAGPTASWLMCLYDNRISGKFSHFTAFFCRLEQFEFLFISQAVRLSLLFTPRYADEDVKLIPNASRDFLPNDFYGIVKISFGFLCSSRSLNIKSRAEWWKHKLCCSTHTNGFCEPWMDVCTAKKGVHSTKSASISFQSLLIH